MAGNFSAKEPSLGYYYQVIYGLFTLLNSNDRDNTRLTIESLDDIVIDDYDGRQDLHQTKFHLRSKVKLTDRNEDFWKTIRVWTEQIEQGLIDPQRDIFFLITTQKVADSSILADLKEQRKKKETIEKVESSLLEICKEETNEKNLLGYKTFALLSPEKRKSLLRNIQIVDQASSFDQLDVKIERAIRTATYPENVHLLKERLIGWWFKKCIDSLHGEIGGITYDDLHNKIASIAETLQRENLPNDFPDPIEITEKTFEASKERVYVKQLFLVQIGPNTVRKAISNFERAFNQRSRWIREKLLSPDEEEKYQKSLIDDWSNKFGLLEDECDDSMDEASLQAKGNEFYTAFYVKQTPQIFIRENFREFFFINGSYHLLADNKKVGWHPKFKTRLK